MLNKLRSPGTPLSLVAILALGACANPAVNNIPGPNLSANVDSVRIAWKSRTLGPIHTYQRLGLNCGGCKVTVTIQGVAGNQAFNPAHPPSSPQPVAHVVNSGNVDTQMYGFKPNYDAYFTVYADSTGAAVWGLVQIPHTGHNILVTRGRGVHGCLPPHMPYGTDADFQTCNGAHHVVRANGSILELATRGMQWIGAAIHAIDTPEDPGWISCTDGCCTLNAD